MKYPFNNRPRYSAGTETTFVIPELCQMVKSDKPDDIKESIASLAVECGVLMIVPSSDEIKESVIGDDYYIELLRECELRHKRLSARYEKMRAAVIKLAEDES